MRSGRIVALALALAGAGALGWAAMVWNRDGSEVEKWRARHAEQKVELKSTLEQLHAHNLRYQAFQKSLPSVPDSVRTGGGSEIREQSQAYTRTIRKLEFKERDIRLEITRCERKEAEAVAARKASALPFAAGGAGAWLCAALVAMVARKRRDVA